MYSEKRFLCKLVSAGIEVETQTVSLIGKSLQCIQTFIKLEVSSYVVLHLLLTRRTLSRFTLSLVDGQSGYKAEQPCRRMRHPKDHEEWVGR